MQPSSAAGPLRVLAPAGSGKTRTLTARIAHLTACGIPAERILALAFNSRAAQEMQTRLANLDISGVRTATFHALGFEVLREQSNWSLDGEKYHEMLEETLAARLDVAPRSSQVEALAKHVLQVRTELVRPDSLLDTLDSSLSFAALYADFCSRQQHARVLNFEDMIYLALQSLLGSESLRRKWQTRFEFVLVDEFQDLNLSQMIFMQVLALPHKQPVCCW